MNDEEVPLLDAIALQAEYYRRAYSLPECRANESLPSQVLLAVAQYREVHRLTEDTFVNVSVPGCHAYTFVHDLAQRHGLAPQPVYDLKNEEVASLLEGWQRLHHIWLTFTEHGFGCVCLDPRTPAPASVSLELSHNRRWYEPEYGDLHDEPDYYGGL